MDTANFAVHPIPGIIDYAVSLNGYPAAVRPGFPCTFNFSYTNRGTTTLNNKEVVFIKDPRLQLVNTNPPYTSMSGDSIKWNISTLLPEGYGNITVNTDIPAIPVMNPGDTVFSAIYIDSTSDYNRFDNYIPLRLPVTGSYDPNDKQGNHGGFLTPAELNSGKWLDYTIRFQNTGNDTAFLVVVRDTLSELLDLGSIRPGASSHPYELEIEDNALKFIFNNILLPDSTVNEPGSHGFVRFQIDPRGDLPLGALVENSAAIYFDYNEPVVTNTCFHTIGLPLISVGVETPRQANSLGMRVMPNPFGEETLLQIDDSSADSQFLLFLYDAQGRPLRAEQFFGSEYVFQRKNLPSGYFFYQLMRSDGKTASGTIVVR